MDQEETSELDRGGSTAKDKRGQRARARLRGVVAVPIVGILTLYAIPHADPSGYLPVALFVASLGNLDITMARMGWW